LTNYLPLECKQIGLRSSFSGEKSQKPNHAKKRTRKNYRTSTYASLYGPKYKIWKMLNYRKSDFGHLEYDLNNP
jgi:hypothetical protein